jgi:hypothetical protein
MRNLVAFALLSGFAGLGCQSNGTNPLPSHDGGSNNGSLCHTCQHDQECGEGNYCLPDPGGGNTCGTSCSNDSDCPNGYWCNAVNGSNGQQIGGACRPANNASCSTMQQQNGSDASTSSNGDAGTQSGNDASTVGGNDAATMGSPDTGWTPCTSDTWSNYAQSMFQSNCVRCHSMYTSFSSVETDGLSIKNDVQSGRMPTDMHLPSTDVARTARWVDCDMPQ